MLYNLMSNVILRFIICQPDSHRFSRLILRLRTTHFLCVVVDTAIRNGNCKLCRKQNLNKCKYIFIINI